MKIVLIYSSNSKNLLKLYQLFLKKIFTLINLKFFLINAPHVNRRKTFLKSPHVNKRSKENFEINIYKFKLYTNLTIPFLKKFRYNVPKNIHLKFLYSI